MSDSTRRNGHPFNYCCSVYPEARGNAEDELKILAKEVTGTCDQPGVAQTLERMLQNGLF